MQFFTDLHNHSKHAQACSNDLNIDTMEKWAKIKGTDILGTGDFTHPEWSKELKQKLSDDEKSGIYKTKTGQKFLLQTEVSLIYTDLGHGRKTHNLILCPNFEVMDQITEYFLSKGRVDYDGRPIFKIPCPQLVEDMLSISHDIEIIPAHCLLPNQYIHIKNLVKPINLSKKGELVLTHKGEFKKITKVLDREYNGIIYHIVPWCFSEGLSVTPEHPFYVIKTDKNCSWTKNLICKPTESHKRICYTQAYKKYEHEWILAKELEKGDIIIYPKIKETKDIKKIKIKNQLIKITPEFCKLAGYYLAEGYTNSRDAFCFTFNNNETEFIEDVKQLVFKIFNIKAKHGKTKGDVIFYSKALYPVFQELFYEKKPFNAFSKIIPDWMIKLPFEKQKELLRGWWRGDKGYTVSRSLANLMKLICLRMNIIPNMRIDTIEKYNQRGNHSIGKRKIAANYDLVCMYRLTFLGDNNELLKDKAFRSCISKKDVKHGWFDNEYIYLPIRKIKTSNYKGKVYNLEVEDHNSYVTEAVTVHNCWTPWFSLFGSNSGWDSINDCFKDKTKYIHALESGLSSNPAMNWRLSQLDKFNIVSFSDSHSYWPWRYGRECTVFDIPEHKLSYGEIIKSLRNREPDGKQGLIETIEVDPNYGKYHWDGHRNCGIKFSPQQTKEHKGICPVCKQQLTIGVDYRVEQLADRPLGFVKKNAVPFRTILPLSEVLGNILQKAMATKTVWSEYWKIMKTGTSENNVLFDVPHEKLLEVTSKEIADAILRNRRGEIKVLPGYDGVYGVPILSDNVKDNVQAQPHISSQNEAKKGKQKGLQEFFFSR